MAASPEVLEGYGNGGSVDHRRCLTVKQWQIPSAHGGRHRGHQLQLYPRLAPTVDPA